MGVTLFQGFLETFKWNKGNPRKDLHIIGPYIGRQRKFGSRPFTLLHSFQKMVKYNQGCFEGESILFIEDILSSYNILSPYNRCSKIWHPFGHRDPIDLDL
mgnify:CR=1 FL=1